MADGERCKGLQTLGEMLIYFSFLKECFISFSMIKTKERKQDFRFKKIMVGDGRRMFIFI